MTDETQGTPEEVQPAAPAPTTPAPDYGAPPPPPPVAGYTTGPPAATPPAPVPPTPAQVPPAAPPSGASAPAGEAPARRSNTAAIIAVAVVLALIIGAFAGLASGFVGAKLAENQGVTGTATPVSVTVVPEKTPEPVVAAAAAALPSVVIIDVTGGETTSSGGLPQGHPSVPFSGNGSGVAFKSVSGGGTYIVTNNHVVEGANSILVHSTTGGKWTAKLVGTDAESDIAVVRIGGDLPPIKVADSSKLQVGQYAIAIGAPFGLEHSVTFGVVSALHRSLLEFGDSTQGQYPLVDAIQTDAAINPGNSGGALVDRYGKLIGIPTAIYGSTTDTFAGVGFAIPSNTALRVADQIVGGTAVQHPFIGIIGETVTSQIAKTRNLSVQEGALVLDFTTGSPAKAAGINVGDVIVALDGKKITSMNDLVLQVRAHKVGETVKIEVIRGGQSKTVSVKVGEKPANVSGSQTTTATP